MSDYRDQAATRLGLELEAYRVAVAEYARTVGTKRDAPSRIRALMGLYEAQERLEAAQYAYTSIE